MEKTEGQKITESNERVSNYMERVSKGHTQNPYEVGSLPDEEDLKP